MHNVGAKNPLVLTLVQYLPTFCIGSCRHKPYLLVRCWRLPQSQQAAVVCTAHQRVFTSRVGRQCFSEPHRAKSAASQPSHRQSACRVGQHKQLSAVTTACHTRLQHYWYILAPLTCVCNIMPTSASSQHTCSYTHNSKIYWLQQTGHKDGMQHLVSQRGGCDCMV